MHTTHSRLAPFALASALAGCGSAHAAPSDRHFQLVDDGPVDTLVSAPARASALGDCLAGGGALVTLGAVNNNDQHDHGTLLRFGLSPSGLVAAAGEDGTLKFWTLDATLVGVVDPGVLTYGSELGGAPITDLDFMGETAIAGDVRGLVQGLGSEGTASVLSGTDPDVPIAAVAYDAPSGHLAHAQGGASAPDVMPLIVKTLDGDERWNVADTLDTITDLAFGPDGALYVGGTDDGVATLEVRAASDPGQRVFTASLGDDPVVVELAVSPEGPLVAVATAHQVLSLSNGDTHAVLSSTTTLRSLATSPSGDLLVTVDESGDVVVSSADGQELGRTSITAAIGARVSADGDRLVVGGSNALLYVLACR